MLEKLLISAFSSLLTRKMSALLAGGGGDPYMEQTGMLVGNVEFNP